MKPLLTGLLFGVAMATLAAPAPTLIPFQGRLTDQAGTAYTNGTYTLIFNLYDEAVGGRLLWTETHERVGVVNGTVNVFLGSINPALANVGFGETRHLGITIDPDNNPNTPDPEMVPRQMIIPAFWAKNSEKLAGADWSSLLVSGNDPVTGRLRGDKLANGSIPGVALANAAISASQIAPGAIGAAQLSNASVGFDKGAPRSSGREAPLNGIATNWFLGSQTWSSTTANVAGSEQSVTNLKVTLTTSGRPVLIILGSSPVTLGSDASFTAKRDSDDATDAGLRIYRNTTNLISDQPIGMQNSSTRTALQVPVSTFSHLDHPPAGTHVYEVRVRIPGYSGGDPNRRTTVEIKNSKISAFEIF